MPTLPNKQLSVPPIEFDLVGKNNKLTRAHIDWMCSIKPTLENTITNAYIQRPHVDANAITSIAKPEDGMDAYNTDVNKPCVRESGDWRYYNTSPSPLANSTPNITTAQRNSLTPSNGYSIINTDTGMPQMYIAGAWRNLAFS